MDKFWIIHGGSDSHFAAKDVNDAWNVVQEMNNIALEYEMHPTSKVEVVDSNSADDVKLHSEELARRSKEGDELYFMP